MWDNRNRFIGAGGSIRKCPRAGPSGHIFCGIICRPGWVKFFIVVVGYIKKFHVQRSHVYFSDLYSHVGSSFKYLERLK